MSWQLEDDGEGNIIFNKILFACMKKAYGQNRFGENEEELKKYLIKLEAETKMNIKEKKKKQ